MSTTNEIARARILCAEVDARFANGNKRKLKLNEGLDVMARVEGRKNHHVVPSKPAREAMSDALLAKTLEAAFTRYTSHGNDPTRAHLRRESAGAFMRALCAHSDDGYGISLGHEDTGFQQVFRFVQQGELCDEQRVGITSAMPNPTEQPLDRPRLDESDAEFALWSTNALRRLCEDVLDPRTATVVAAGNIRTEGPGCYQNGLIDVRDGEFAIPGQPTHVVQLGLCYEEAWCGRLSVRPIPASWTGSEHLAWLLQNIAFEDVG